MRRFQNVVGNRYSLVLHCAFVSVIYLFLTYTYKYIRAYDEIVPLCNNGIGVDKYLLANHEVLNQNGAFSLRLFFSL